MMRLSRVLKEIERHIACRNPASALILPALMSMFEKGAVSAARTKGYAHNAASRRS